MILGKETAFRFFGCCSFLFFKKKKKAASNKARSNEDIAVQEAAGKDGCFVIALS